MKRKPTIIFTTMVLIICSIGFVNVRANESITSNQHREEQANNIQSHMPPTLLLNDGVGKYPLGLVLEILEDKNKHWTLEDVTSQEFSELFIPSERLIPNMGFSDSAYWVRFRIRNEATQITSWWLELSLANINFVDIYQMNSDGEAIIIEQTGNLLPFATRSVNHRYFISKMTLAHNNERTVYMRIENKGPTSIPLTVYSRKAFSQKDYSQQFVLGIFYGIMMIMVCQNLLIFLALHERSYIYYVLFVASFMMTQLSADGFSKQYLWPNAGRWSSISEIFFTVVFTISALKFTSIMLLTKTHTPTLHRIMNFLVLLLAVGGIFLCFTNDKELFVILADYGLILLSYGTLFVVNYIIWQRGYRPARYYTPAWIGFSIGLGTVFFVRVGILASNLIIQGLQQAGVILLMLVLSLALADRFNVIKQEKSDAQDEALRLKDELNLTLRQVNDELEMRVEERTQDITFLYEITSIAGEPLELQKMFERFLGRVLSVLTGDTSCIHLLDKSDKTLDLAAQFPISHEAENDFGFDKISVEGTLWGEVITSNRPVVTNEFISNHNSPNQIEYPYQSYVGVPIRVGGEVLGVLSILGDMQMFPGEKVNILMSAAEQIGIAVERTQLRQQNDQAILVSERQRLARELHDVVTQSLYSLELFINGGIDHAQSGNLNKVQEYFSEIGEITHEILIEMRLLLHELLPLDLKADGLIKAIQNRLDAVERRINVDTELNVEEYFELPKEMQMGLYRVTQEALNNAIKHSKAKHVSVRIFANQHRVDLEIIDDGVGFTTKDENAGGMGLLNLQDRVQSLGGKLIIDSTPGKGTKVLAYFEDVSHGNKNSRTDSR